MKCPNCQVKFFPIVGHKSQQDNTAFHVSLSGYCSKCKQWFKWEETYVLNEITIPICENDGHL